VGYGVISPGEAKLRMPIFSYFVVVGAALTGILLWLGSVYPPNPTILTSSQTIGVPKFKAEPEPKYATVTTFNFAAAYARPAAKENKVENKVEATRRKPKVTVGYSEPPAIRRFAEFPHDNLSIH
jgi:hypothetical protein